MAIRPLGDRVIIKPAEQAEEKIGGIIIPDTAKEKPQEGEVVAVGPGKLMENGEMKPVSVSVGDKVLYGKYSSTEVKYGDSEYLIVSEDNILAVIE